MILVERIKEIKREHPLEPVKVLVPNRGTGVELHRELCHGLGSFAAVEIMPVGEFLRENFYPGGRRALTDVQRIIAIMKALDDDRSAERAPQLFTLKDNFALIDKLNTSFKQLEYLTEEDIDTLLEAAEISATFRQALHVFRAARALYAADYYEPAEIYRIPPASGASTLFAYNLDYAAKSGCILGALDAFVPVENRFDDARSRGKIPAEVAKLSDPETECVWAVQQVISALHDESLKPADIAIAYGTDRGYSTALKLYLDEAGIANRLSSSPSLNSSTLFKALVDELLAAAAATPVAATAAAISEVPAAEAATPGGTREEAASPNPANSLAPLRRNVYAHYSDLLDDIDCFAEAGIRLTSEQLSAYIDSYYLKRSTALEPVVAGEISVAPIGDLYGRAFKRLIVLGISETIAPATFQQDSIINFTDIELLQALTGKDPLPTLAQSIALQERRFRLLVEKGGVVSLSVPAQTDKGTELIESRWLGNCIEFDAGILEKVPVNRMKLIDSTASDRPHDTDLLSTRYFETKYRLEDDIVRANRALRSSRLNHKFDKYNGKIKDPRLKGFFGHWSASGFELYAKNPFDFFMKNVLGLREPGLDTNVEAFSELDAMDFGTVLHACLEELTGLFVQQGELDSGDIDKAIKAALVSLFDTDSDRRAKYPEIATLLESGEIETVLARQLSNQIRDAREKLIAWSGSFKQEIEGYNVFTETVFDTKKGTGKKLSLLNGNSIMLDGRIDRIDVHSATGQKRVVDYKIGKPRDVDPDDLTGRGRKFQLQLYALLTSDEQDFSDIEKAEYQYFGCEDPPQARTATPEALIRSYRPTLAYLTAMTACIESGTFPYKASLYGSPFMKETLGQESDRNRLARFLHGPYRGELEKVEMQVDQVTRDAVIDALAAYEREGY